MLNTNIRHAVFETNSSSTHSISIADTGGLLDRLPISEGKVIIESGEFGREWEDYNDASSKASYLAIYCRDWSRDNLELFFNNLKQAILEQTQAEDVVFLIYEKSKWGSDGYIDHQSVEGGELDWLLSDVKEIKNFIFNPSSNLRTGDDNG